MMPQHKSLSMIPGALLLTSFLASLLACTDEAPQALDGGGGAVDQQATQDLPAEVDGPVLGEDLGASDTTPLSAPTCDPALDLAPLELAPTYCVVRRLTLAGRTESFTLRGLSAFTLEALDEATTWRVLQWPLDQTPGQNPTPSTFFSFAPQWPADATKLFPGRDLSLSPGGQIAGGFTSDLIDGAIFWGDQGSQPQQVGAMGNYNVAFLDESTLLINGLGVGEANDYQGVYVVQQGHAPRKLIDQIGTLSGHLAVGDHALFAGGYLNDTNEVYGFSLGKITAAINSGATLTPADGTLTYVGNLLDLAAVGDDLVVAEADAYQDFTSLARILVSVSGDTVAPSDAEIIISNSARFIQRVASDQGQIALIWQEGLDTALAVIMPRK